MSDARFGVASIIADAAPLLPERDQIEELDLFADEPTAGPIEGSARALRAGARPADPGTDRARRLDLVDSVRPARRGPGRPEGAKNRSTEALKRYLRERYRDPLLGLFDVQATPPAELVKLMVPPGETPTREDYRFAWSMWRDCTFEAAEFLTPKEPRALTITPGSAPLMSVNLTTDQLTLGGVSPGHGMQLGMSESAMKSMGDGGIGGEVLEGEVLQPLISAGKSDA